VDLRGTDQNDFRCEDANPTLLFEASVFLSSELDG